MTALEYLHEYENSHLVEYPMGPLFIMKTNDGKTIKGEINGNIHFTHPVTMENLETVFNMCDKEHHLAFYAMEDFDFGVIRYTYIPNDCRICA